jgi:hypothetical protein
MKAWAGYGMLWAVTALTSPVTLSVLPFLTAWICYRHRRERRWAWLGPASVSALVFAVAVSPWFVRNYRIFHQFVPFRDTLGLELHVGNNGDSSHWHPNAAGPWHNDAEYGEYKQLGEIAYMARKRQQATQFISSHPGWFAWMTARRAVYLWTGFWSFDRRYLDEEPMDLANIPFTATFSVLALLGLLRAFRRAVPEAMPLAIVLFFYPVVYYVTHPEVYYLRPLDPMIVILVASLVLRRKRKAEELEIEHAETELVEA